MTADEVLRALKECGDCDNCPYYSCWIDEETGDPADACNDGRLFKDILSLIESLQAQLKLEHGGALAAAENCLRLQGEVNDLQTQLAAEKRRERAAVEDMKVMALAMRESEEISEGCCFACKYDAQNLPGDVILGYGECPGYECNDCFEWRGDAEEGDAE